MTDTTSLDDLRDDLERRARSVSAMGGEQKLATRRAAGVLNARERVDALVDDGSWREIGQHAHSHRAEMRDRTPADGKVCGYARVDGREIALVSNDFTVLGASSSTVNGRKVQHVKETSEKRGLPVVFFGESSGGRMPDVMGASNMASQRSPGQYRRARRSPWVSAILGHCYGSSAWYACLSDVVVMRKGSRLAVASPRLSAMATGEQVDEEELAGWRLHATTSGLVDIVVDTDDEAVKMVQRVLSYLPSGADRPPPRCEVVEDDQLEAERREKIAALIPTRRASTYDMRKVVSAVVDDGSMLELKAMFGRSMITALGRIDGRPVGIVANNPMFKGGAIDAEASSKVTGFLVLCDSYNLPIVFVTDQPGFLIGGEGEKKAMPGRVMNWMNALSMCTVPKFAIVARKSYGQAVLNMGLGGNADEVCAWTTAEIGFMDPGHATTIVGGVRHEDDPEEFARLKQEMALDTSVYDAAGVFSVQEVIDPRDTRQYLRRILEVHCRGADGVVGEGHMRTWPTTVF